MDADKLPSEHDVIVLGTGMTESIVAAALSRIGLRVLHLDRNDSYGGDWGAFNFTALRQWISDKKGQNQMDVDGLTELSSLLSSTEQLVRLPTESFTITNLEETVHIPGKADVTHNNVEGNTQTPLSNKGVVDEGGATPDTNKDTDQQQSTSVAEPKAGDTGAQGDEPKMETNVESAADQGDVAEKQSSVEPAASESLDFARVEKLWRKFSIDLMPKILYNRGSLVELLISSDVSKYCEFRCITRVLTLLKEKLELVPCSRADVFASHDVSVIEKRLLMKFLTFAIEYQKHPGQYAGFEDRPFVEFLKSKHLTETIQHYVRHAIAMVTDTATTMEGLEAMQKFLTSLGRYGNTAFLWPLYGSGELLQCFCRLCAVFGGIYCLRRSAKAAVLNEANEVCAIVDSEGQRLETKFLVMDASYASSKFLPNAKTFSQISRAILVTNRSVKPHKEQQITLMSLPLPDRNDSRATIYELSSLSLACPDEFYVVHLTCRSLASDAKTDLQPILDILFQSPGQESEDDSRPQIIWSMFFNIADTSSADLTCDTTKNLFVVGGPDFALDCDQSIAAARSIFEKICPGEEFLPRAPNPEDIIYDDGENSQPRESGFEPIPEASTETDNIENANDSNEISVESLKISNSEAENTESVSGAVDSSIATSSDLNTNDS